LFIILKVAVKFLILGEFIISLNPLKINEKGQNTLIL